MPIHRPGQQQLLRDLVQGMQYKSAMRTQQERQGLPMGEASDYLNQGTTYAYQKNFKQAIASYTKAISLEPNYIPARINRGIIFSKQEKPVEALHDFAAALQTNPNNAFLLQKKGGVLDELGQYEEALEVYEQMLLRQVSSEAYIGK